MSNIVKRAAIGVILAGGAVGLMVASLTSDADSAVVVASVYSDELRGHPTASGEPFNPDGMTAASNAHPLGTRLDVSYKGESVNVRVNDYGPAVPGRTLDLSKGAADAIGLEGVDAVSVSQTTSEPITELPNTSGEK
jgi:rare lipoprotein A